MQEAIAIERTRSQTYRRGGGRPVSVPSGLRRAVSGSREGGAHWCISGEV